MTTPYIDPSNIHVPSATVSPPAAWGNTVRDDLQFLARPPGCQLNMTAGQVISTSPTTSTTGVVWQAVSFPSALNSRDTDGFHSSTGTDVTVPSGLGGWYQATIYLSWQASLSRLRGVRFLRDGNVVTNAVYYQSVELQATRFTMTDEFQLSPGNVFRVEVYQNSGVGQTLEIARLSMRLVSL